MVAPSASAEGATVVLGYFLACLPDAESWEPPSPPAFFSPLPAFLPVASPFWPPSLVAPPLVSPPLDASLPFDVSPPLALPPVVSVPVLLPGSPFVSVSPFD